ncbi:hypothetical protein S40293_11497 [Stachybotrys chartarum IBT 40293]|nr:hypothetical protein S40293_11497 [Stachybotrys chartarum IBT 40293]
MLFRFALRPSESQSCIRYIVKGQGAITGNVINAVIAPCSNQDPRPIEEGTDPKLRQALNASSRMPYAPMRKSRGNDEGWSDLDSSLQTATLWHTLQDSFDE